ncbi:MFS transporter [Cellulomonas uda]|uniref:MFS transporter n=1 Tax=Cellulomonas uda TaxID=1714 RepID=A0A4Y3KCR3_CELUD|nr:MFS transporter [Cellulomonas uda]NII66683.1 EmrB/QacA subfamily drug resistance transporter [Cellulomonas uda]GEA81752.1 MFS transporter [Cellulomonas uda]
MIAPASPRRRPASSVLVLAAILTTQLMLVLDMTIVNVALPDLQSSLGFTPTGLSWVLNAYTLAFGGLLLLGARTGDLLGRRRVLVAGIALFTAASLVGGIAAGPGVLLAARAAQGVGAAFAAPSALALLMARFPEGAERARALGYFSAVSIGGSALGLIAGGMLTQWASWRWVMFVNVPIGLALVALVRAVLPETPRHPGRFDLVGAATSTIGMTALVYGFVEAAEDGWGAPTTLASFTVGALLLAAFVLTELRAPAPITPLRLFADRTRSAALGGRLLLMAAMTGLFFFLTQFLQDVLGYSPLATGVAFLPITVMLLVFSQVSARLMQRVGNRPLLVVGLATTTVALLLLSRIDAGTGYPQILVALVLFGIGNGLAFVPLTAAGLQGVDPRDAGAASGLVNASQQIGGALGLAVLVTVAESAARAAAPVGATALEVARHAFVAGAQQAFLVGAGLTAATVVLLAALVRRPTPAPTVVTPHREATTDERTPELALAD